MVSYCSFFIDHKVIPGRVTLGIVPVLTAFAQLGNTMRSMPRFSYTSWLGEFLFVHTIFPVAAMFEYTLISYVEWHSKHQEEKKKQAAQNIMSSVIALPKTDENQDPEQEALKGGQPPAKKKTCVEKCDTPCARWCRTCAADKPQRIDIAARVIYMVLYIIALLILFLIPISNEYVD